METIINKVAESGIITLDLEQYMPSESEVMEFDIKPFLFKELLLREKDFRTALQEYDFSIFKGKHVAVTCSSEAIIPMWAYMLISMYLMPHAASIIHGTKAEAIYAHAIHTIQSLNIDEYKDARVIIKGCGDRGANEGMYMAMSERLLPIVKSLMFGEPCSTVPIYKKKKAATQ